MKKIAIHSVPRSGSTWLGNIFNSHPDVAFKYQPLFSYAFKDYLNSQSTLQDIEDFFKKIKTSNDSFINQNDAITNGLVPRFEKSENTTHVCYKEVRYHYILENMLRINSSVKVILLIRNPLATLYSWKNAPKEFRQDQGWVFEDEWLQAPSKNMNKIEEFNGYEKWKEVALMFYKLKEKFPSQVYLLNYVNLLKNTHQEVENLFDFSDLSFSNQTQKFLNTSKTKDKEDAYSVFKIKKEDQDWKNLPNHIIEYVYNDLNETELELYLH